MSIKNTMVKIAEKITGRKCCRCVHNCGGRCCHPNGETFCRCWQSITRPGFEYSEAVHHARAYGAAFSEGFKDGLAAPGDITDMRALQEKAQEYLATLNQTKIAMELHAVDLSQVDELKPGDLTPEEKYQLGKIVESLQEASETAKDGGLLGGFHKKADEWQEIMDSANGEK